MGFFDGFEVEFVDVGEATLRVRHGGEGPPIVLLHGHPRTHATWHPVTRIRLIVAVLVANSVLTLVAIGWLAWIVADPDYWFPGAYAEKGERGEQGPRGPVGQSGPAGRPVGPDAADAIAEVSAGLVDLAARLDELEGQTAGVDVATLESEIEDVSSRLEEACSQLGLATELRVLVLTG